MAAQPTQTATKEIQKEFAEINNAIDRLEIGVRQVEKTFELVLSKVPSDKSNGPVGIAAGVCDLGTALASFRVRINTLATNLEDINSRSQL